MDDFGKALEPFYGKDYCLRMTMDLEKIRDEQFQGNDFLFKKGWLENTILLLHRLQHMGFPVRTRDHILVHLAPPVEKMAMGELYLQAGRQLPGKLSLKFTRRQHDGTMVIQPTVLEQEEECRLAADPSRYLEELRTTARSSVSSNDVQYLLNSLIVLNNRCERQRVNVNSFFQRHFEQTGNYMSQFHTPVRVRSDSSADAQQCYQAVTSTSFSATCSTPLLNENYPRRSGSEGNIIWCGGSPGDSGQRFKGPCQRHTEPEENDENHEIVAGNQAAHCQRSVFTEEYAGTTEGIAGLSPRRSSNDSTGRTSLQDEYTGMIKALSSFTLSRDPSNTVRDGSVRRKNEAYPNTACALSEEYASTRSVFEVHRDTWNSHQDADSHAGYRQMYTNSVNHETLLPVPVEELNNAAIRPVQN